MADIFISYAHSDNAFPRFGPDGWIDWLHRAVDARLTQIRGRPTTFWRDATGGIAGNSILSPAIEQAVAQSKVFVAVLSPAYAGSEWCLKELGLFRDQAKRSGAGLRVGTKSRLMQVIKLPIPDKAQLANLSEIVDVTGYEFSTRRPDGRSLELTPEDRPFFEVVNSLAYDLADILDEIDGSSGIRGVAPAVGVNIYLAETSSDVKAARDHLRHELRQFGYTVLPDGDFEHDSEYGQRVRAALHESRCSVHVIGNNLGPTPERSPDTVVEIQYAAALDEEQNRPSFSRLCWMPPGLDTSDTRDRYQTLIARVSNDRSLYQGSLEDFKASIEKALRAKPPPPTAAAPGNTRSVYLIFEPGDAEGAKRIEDWLYDEGFDPKTPLSEGSDVERRKIDRDYLKLSDAVLIYHGITNEFWLKKKLNDLEKIAGYGRKRPFLARGVVLADPKTELKERFRDRNYIAIKGFGEFSRSEMETFARVLRGMPGADAVDSA